MSTLARFGLCRRVFWSLKSSWASSSASLALFGINLGTVTNYPFAPLVALSVCRSQTVKLQFGNASTCSRTAKLQFRDDTKYGAVRIETEQMDS